MINLIGLFDEFRMARLGLLDDILLRAVFKITQVCSPNCFSATSFHNKSYVLNLEKAGLVTLWPIFSQTHPVTLVEVAEYTHVVRIRDLQFIFNYLYFIILFI
jgi:hypothetical protein